MITALVGAQLGSEGKGAVAAALAHDYNIHVRTGAPNAGHTIYYNGVKYAMQSVPCGWINPQASLVLGPGAMIELEILRRELGWITEAGLPAGERLFIDPRALILDKIHSEGGIHGDAHALIGSTGKGVGICRMAHLARGTVAHPEFHLKHAKDHAEELMDLGVTLSDMSVWLNKRAKSGWSILLEGTQGSGLSVVTGPWPYVTSCDTNSGQLLVDAGLSPRLLTGTILVARTYPIRVAGNSGPMRGEIGWDELGVEPEITTVTKKIRRVGKFDPTAFRDAQRLNGPGATVALMFLDYVFPEVYGATEVDHLSEEAKDWIAEFRVSYSCDMVGVGTGPTTFIKLGSPQ